MHRHFKIYKPFGYLSQFISNQNTRKNKRMLGELHDFPSGTMSIGRLDQDSEGLLLLTTDGKVSAEINGGKVEKEYLAQVDGEINIDAVNKMKKGVEIGIQGQTYRTNPCVAEILPAAPELPPRAKKIRDERHGPTSWVRVVLTEGKFRQVKKMTAAVGFPTLRLIRVRIGNETLEGMLPGTVREMDAFDYCHGSEQP